MPSRPTGGGGGGRGGVNDGGHDREDAARSNRSWDDVRSDEMVKECGRESVATKRTRFSLKGDDVEKNSEVDTTIIREVSSS